ncbi:MAG: universal stress protein [Candidatus Tectomicrobia bacterium]|nr:universal stress protein [Candidatus Tectomicrobia bacterium]
MYRSIYVPVDASEHARRAADLAVELARRCGAALTGSHVVEDPLAATRLALLRRTPAGAPFSAGPHVVEGETSHGESALRPSRAAAPPGDGASPAVAEAFASLAQRSAAAGLTFERKTLRGSHHRLLARDIEAGAYDLVILGAHGGGAVKESLIGSVCERVVRRVSTDTLIVRATAPLRDQLRGGIVVGIDGSPQSMAGLLTAVELGRLFETPVEAVAVYDPYLHYTMFNGIVGVLNEQASRVFRFKEQEQLHEEIIDTGLAKIYQSHLEIAQQIAREQGASLKITLLDGKAFEKMLLYLRRQQPWLVVLGRYGVHRDGESAELGSNTENLLRSAPCNVLLTARTFYPRIDLKAEESIAWTEEAQERMKRVPPLVTGIARTAILRYAIERGHSVVTSKVIDEAMHIFMPEGTARAMGDAAKKLAAATVEGDARMRSICTICGYAAKEEQPRKCPVCGAGAESFQHIDRQVVQAIIDSEGGVQVEETFDGVALKWTVEARALLRGIEDTYQRRRAKARIEKRARSRKLSAITADFARPIIEEASGVELGGAPPMQAPVTAAPGSADAAAEGAEADAARSPFVWLDEAVQRLRRVPAGFMREMTRSRIEALAAERGATTITLRLAEDAIGQARQVMDSMVGAYMSEEGRSTLRRAAASPQVGVGDDAQPGTIKSATRSRDVPRLNEVTLAPYPKPNEATN